MNKSTPNLFDGELEVVTTLAGAAIQASISELRTQDELTVALRTMLRQGADINDLSASCGLSPKEIRRRCESELFLGEDMTTLAGLR